MGFSILTRVRFQTQHTSGVIQSVRKDEKLETHILLIPTPAPINSHSE